MPPKSRDRKQSRPETPREPKETTEKVVFINRCAKVVKGGRRFSFSALIVCGDQKGKVGVGFGKANEVSEAIRKATDASKKRMVKIAVQENTIPHMATGEFGGGRLLLRELALSLGAASVPFSKRSAFVMFWPSLLAPAITPMSFMPLLLR